MAKKQLTLFTALTFAVLVLAGCGKSELVKTSPTLPELEQYTEQCPPPDMAYAGGIHDINHGVGNSFIRDEINKWLSDSVDFQELKSVWTAKGLSWDLKEDEYITAIADDDTHLVGVSHSFMDEGGDARFTMVAFTNARSLNYAATVRRMYLRESYFKGPTSTRTVWSESGQLKQCSIAR